MLFNAVSSITIGDCPLTAALFLGRCLRREMNIHIPQIGPEFVGDDALVEPFTVTEVKPIRDIHRDQRIGKFTIHNTPAATISFFQQ